MTPPPPCFHVRWHDSLCFTFKVLVFHLFAKDCLLLVLVLVLLYDHMVVCLFDGLSPCRKWPNTRKMVVDCPPVITSICDTLLQTRQDQERGMVQSGPSSLLHSWHWVLFNLVLRNNFLHFLNLDLFVASSHHISSELGGPPVVRQSHGC